jgi:drug/metabolite transporter (DMT)-like permease
MFGFNILFIIATIIINVLAGFFAKLHAMQLEKVSYVYLVLSIGLYGAGFIFFMISLKKFPLYVVQSSLSLQYVLLILTSFFYFNEVITFNGWLGMVFIFIGLCLLFFKGV